MHMTQKVACWARQPPYALHVEANEGGSDDFPEAASIQALRKFLNQVLSGDSWHVKLDAVTAALSALSAVLTLSQSSVPPIEDDIHTDFQRALRSGCKTFRCSMCGQSWQTLHMNSEMLLKSAATLLAYAV